MAYQYYKKPESDKKVEPKKERPKTIKEWNNLTPCERWEFMTLTEISAECLRYHITYGQAQSLQQRRQLPADFGKRGKKNG